MIPYIITHLFLFFTVILSLLNNKNSKFFIYFMVFILIVLSGIRNDIGIDYGTYYAEHQDLIHGLDSHFEKGYIFFSKLVDFLGFTFQGLIFFSALITMSLFIVFYLSYSRAPILSIYLFVMFPIFYLASFNTIRQFISVAIFTLAIKYIINKSLYKYLFYIFLASLFHKAIIILAPIYFVIRFKTTGSLLFLYFIFFYVVLQAINFLISLLGFSSIYSAAIFSAAKINAQIVVLGLIFIFIYIFKEKLYQQNHNSSIFINMLFLGLLISMSPLMVTYIPEPFLRYTTYFTIVIPILLVNIINLIKNKNIRYIYFLSLIIFSTLYFYITLVYNGKTYELVPYEANIEFLKG